MVQESQNNDDPPCDSTGDADPVDPRREAHLGLGDIGLRVSQIGSATLVEPAILVGDTTLVEPITRIESATLDRAYSPDTAHYSRSCPAEDC